MTRILLFCIIGIIASTAVSRAQSGIGIGTDTPDPQSILDIQSTTRGVLIPRMTTVQRNLIGVDAADFGMMIYNTDDNEFNYWDGSSWQAFPAAGAGGSDDDWHVGLGATPPTNISDNIWTNGRVGIGTNNPLYTLDVRGDILIESGGVEHTIRGGNTGSLWLRSNSGIIMQLEDDGDTFGYFRIKNNAGGNIFRVDHDGLVTIDGDVTLTDGGNIITFFDEADANIVVDHPGTDAELDIEADSDIDIVIDKDNNGTTAEFAIKRNSDGAADVNKLMTVSESNTPLVFPYGTGAGNTGGIRFRELAAGGTNSIGLRAPDALGANVTLTLPNTAGSSGDLLQTDGTGALSWLDPSGLGGGSDSDWLVEGSGASPSNSTDNIYTEGEVGIGTTAPAYDLEVVGDVKFEGDFINQEILGAHSGTSQNIAFTNGVFTPLTGTTVSVTIQDGSGVNHSGVLLTGFARVFGGNLTGNTSSAGSYYIVLERDTDPAFGAPSILTYTAGLCYLETPNGAVSATLGLSGGGHVSYVDAGLSAGVTYYYRLSFYTNGVGITGGTYSVLQRDLNLIQIKR